MSLRKILIVSYYWPPSGGVGVQRWMNFALQLKIKGWMPIILTPENPQFDIKDEKLTDEVKDIPVYKVPIWEPYNLFHKITGNRDRKNVRQGLVLEKSDPSFFDQLVIWIRGNILVPDPRIFWVRKASHFAIDLIKQENVSTIITTGPPHSVHLIGRRIKKKTGIKWLADFRDPWSKWDLLKQLKTSKIIMSFHRKLEKSVLNEADFVTTASGKLALAFEGNITVLRNGVTLGQGGKTKTDEHYFTIGYFGMLNELRNPSQLWLTLDQMCRENDMFFSKLRVRIGGILSATIKKELSKLHKLNKKVEFLGYLPHHTIQEEYQKCNLLLVLQNKTDNSQWLTPVKFFEYLVAKRMILCLGEQLSDLGDLMNGREIGEIFSYSDVAGIRTFILEIFENKKLPSEKDTNELLRQFSHKSLVKKLEYLIK